MITKAIFNFEVYKQKYLNKSPLDKWLLIRHFNIFLLKSLGVQFMETNYKLHFKSWIPMYLGANYFSLLLYTLYYYRKSPYKVLQGTPMCGLLIPVGCWFLCYLFLCIFISSDIFIFCEMYKISCEIFNNLFSKISIFSVWCYMLLYWCHQVESNIDTCTILLAILFMQTAKLHQKISMFAMNWPII